jgi:hypothetical protein
VTIVAQFASEAAMTILRTIALLAGVVLMSNAASSEELVRPANKTRVAQTVCAQVISCGTKDGKRKEYPTPCAAKDDGATDVAPKSGSTC